MEKVEKKIDELAQMTARGFAAVQDEFKEVRENIENVRKEMATKEELSSMREEMATKDDLATLRQDIDLMLDRHIGTFRKDHDELAARVKKLEEAVFQQR